MYTVAIHLSKPDRDPFAERWAHFLTQYGAKVRWVDLMASDALAQVRDCHGVMWRFRHASTQKDAAWRLLTCLERYMGIPVFPDWHTAWHYDEKTTQDYIFKAIDVPTPQTWVFWDKDEALEWAKTTSYPVVYKMSHGASSDNVGLIHNRKQAIRLIQLCFGPGIMPSDVAWARNGGGAVRGMIVRWRRWLGRIVRETEDALGVNLDSPFGRPYKGAHGYAYFQEFIPHNAFDVRVTLLGKRAFAFRRFNREDDFRASGSGKIDFDKDAIDPRCIRMAFDAARKLQLASCGFDFLFKDGDPLLSEISYTFAGATARCPGYFTPDGSWVNEQMEPQEAQVADFIALIEQRQQASGTNPKCEGPEGVG